MCVCQKSIYQQSSAINFEKKIKLSLKGRKNDHIQPG